MTVTVWFTLIGAVLVLLAMLGLVADIEYTEDEKEFFDK